MKKLILLFSLALILSACSLFSNKTKNKSKTSIDSSFVQKTQTLNVDTSKTTINQTITTTTKTPGITTTRDHTLSPYTHSQYNYLSQTFDKLNLNTSFLRLTIDSFSNKIRVVLRQPPATTTTVTHTHTVQKNGISTATKTKKQGTFNKKSVDLNAKTKPNNLFIAACFVATCLALLGLYLLIKNRTNK